MEKCEFIGCKKKSLILFGCRCAHKFCEKHKQPECHACTFDFVEHHRQKLAQENVRIVASKLTEF
jgi:hypothetical protein